MRYSILLLLAFSACIATKEVSPPPYQVYAAAELRDEVQAEIDVWNQDMGRVVFIFNSSTPPSSEACNAVVVSTSPLKDGLFGVARPTYSGCGWTVQLSDRGWTTTTVRHELGHTLGMEHSDCDGHGSIMCHYTADRDIVPGDIETVRNFWSM